MRTIALLLPLLPPALSAPSVFFGNGCFWHMQHLLTTELEQGLLGRDAADLTSTAGYAGGKEEPTPLCYPSEADFNNHEEFGSAEVVSVELEGVDQVEMAASIFFNDFARTGRDTWARKDGFDQGAQFRAVVGLPGGLGGEYGDALGKGNVHNVRSARAKRALVLLLRLPRLGPGVRAKRARRRCYCCRCHDLGPGGRARSRCYCCRCHELVLAGSLALEASREARCYCCGCHDLGPGWLARSRSVRAKPCRQPRCYCRPLLRPRSPAAACLTLFRASPPRR